jgi:hypothetical protein
MIAKALTLVAIVGGAYLVYLWFRKSGAAHDTTFKDQVLHDTARWLAGHLKANEADVVPALRGLIENGVPHPLLAPVQQIDCEIVQLTPTTARRTVVVMIVQDDGNARVGKIAREVGWEDLPDSVRGEFIHLGGDAHTFRIVGSASVSREVSA